MASTELNITKMKRHILTDKYFKLLIISLCTLLQLQFVSAQRVFEKCGTPSSAYDKLTDIRPENFRILAGTRVIKMHVVIYANDDGSSQAISEEELKTEILFANSIYNQGEICFALVGVEVRNNTFFNSAIFGFTNFSGQTVSGAFTVFIVNTINDGIFGWAPSTPATYMITKKSGFGTRRTFIHEMGHAFGLEHTFKGTARDADNPGCDELVNGTNGTTCGDFVTDTPADPYTRCGTNSLSGCTFPYTAPGCVDANSSSYSPQMNNMMSYWANYGCDRTIFSNGQYARMRSFIDNTLSLILFLATDNLVLSNATISSGFVRQGAKLSIIAGNAGSGNYTLNGTVQATYSANAVTATPGFTASPSGTGVVRILASSCY